MLLAPAMFSLTAFPGTPAIGVPIRTGLRSLGPTGEELRTSDRGLRLVPVFAFRWRSQMDDPVTAPGQDLSRLQTARVTNPSVDEACVRIDCTSEILGSP